MRSPAINKGVSALNWKVDRGAGADRVLLEGEITEDSHFGRLLPDLGSSVVFDLAGVKRINSTGVREWINFVNELTKAGKTYALERCSVPIVSQLNMISNFRGKGDVRSVYAPYSCGTCRNEQVRLIECAGDPAAELEKSETCVKCGSAMEFDDIPEAYLAFRA